MTWYLLRHGLPIWDVCLGRKDREYGLLAFTAVLLHQSGYA